MKSIGMKYIKKIIFTLLNITIGLSQAYDGYTIFSPVGGGPGGPGGGNSYLINNDLETIHTWSHSRGAASMPYLLPDSSIIYPFRVQNPTMIAGGVGGGIAHILWDGFIVWEFIVSNDIYQHHHDVQPLPSGNVLVIAWERKTAEEAAAMGRFDEPFTDVNGDGEWNVGEPFTDLNNDNTWTQAINNALGEIWAEAILEIEPVGSDNGNVVWEWHIWDHLIQNYDPSLPGYGNISDHPELMDINYGNAGSDQGPGGPNGDWKHFNAIDYNADLDQIVISSRHHDEIYIIDHSTTTLEAAGHTGGNSGMGGDILYRWGNPQVYDRGNDDDQLLDSQHGVNWIPEGFPGAGNLILYNNNYSNNNSAVFEIVTPVGEDGNYTIEVGQPYDPEGPVWMHSGGFHSNVQSGAFRLPNGNTLITDADDARMFEVTNSGTTVWNYDYPGGTVNLARAQKYDPEYLTGTIEFPEYTVGDVNFDGLFDIIDLCYIVNMMTDYGYYPTPPADINGDGNVNISDLVSFIQLIMQY